MFRVKIGVLHAARFPLGYLFVPVPCILLQFVIINCDTLITWNIVHLLPLFLIDRHLLCLKRSRTSLLSLLPVSSEVSCKRCRLEFDALLWRDFWAGNDAVPNPAALRPRLPSSILNKHLSFPVEACKIDCERSAYEVWEIWGRYFAFTWCMINVKFAIRGSSLYKVHEFWKALGHFKFGARAF